MKSIELYYEVDKTEHIVNDQMYISNQLKKAYDENMISVVMSYDKVDN